MSKWVKLIAVLVIASAAVSCSTRKKGQEAVVEIDETVTSVAPSGTPEAIQNSFLNKANSMGIANSGRYNWDDVLSNRTVYFEYDSSALDPESQLIVEAHAEYLSGTGGSVGLEGHTDERGTNEYNLALGERRAATVATVMSAMGAGNANIVSYGEESPISEEYWKNRRVEIVY